MYFSKMLSEAMSAEERYAICRLMTPEQRLQEAHRLWWVARRERAAAIQKAHPEWSEESVQVELKRVCLAEAMQEG